MRLYTRLPYSGYFLFLAAVLSLWSIVWLFVPDPIRVTTDYWLFFPLGIGGAIAANSTGAGGGIVFIPAFTALGMSGADSLGTSIAIQCFGMTVGSVSWLLSIHGDKHGHKTTHLTYRLLWLATSASVAGMLCGQYLFPVPSFPVSSLFRYFSILFGGILLFIALRKHPNRHTQYSIRRGDVFPILITGFAGGAVTSWISVGAGEWLALLLFFLGFPTMVAVCVAVCVSAATVLSGVPYHIFIANSISWEILLFAAPAAMIGGSIARLLAQRLGPIRLKIFFAAWVLATGLSMS